MLPFDVPDDAEYWIVCSELEAAGKPIGSNDLLVAADASALGMTVATADAEFKRVRGLKVTNCFE